MDPLSQAILKTVLYADIFDFALTRSELIAKLQTPTPVSKDLVEAVLDRLITQAVLLQKAGYVCLPHRKRIIQRRARAAADFKTKSQCIYPWLVAVKRIPWLKAIFLTGSVAVGNSDAQDDIDLMVVTSSNRLWLTRLILTILSDFWGIRRKPKHTHFSNKICLNLFLELRTLTVPPAARSLYTAHEIIQAKSLWNREKVDQLFLDCNQWVTQYLPMAQGSMGDADIIPNPQKISQLESRDPSTHRQLFSWPQYFLDKILTSLNYLCYWLQRLYMQRHLTRERIGLHSAYFHPRPTRELIEQQFAARKKRFGLV